MTISYINGPCNRSESSTPTMHHAIRGKSRFAWKWNKRQQRLTSFPTRTKHKGWFLVFRSSNAGTPPTGLVPNYERTVWYQSINCCQTKLSKARILKWMIGAHKTIFSFLIIIIYWVWLYSNNTKLFNESSQLLFVKKCLNYSCNYVSISQTKFSSNFQPYIGIAWLSVPYACVKVGPSQDNAEWPAPKPSSWVCKNHTSETRERLQPRWDASAFPFSGTDS